MLLRKPQQVTFVFFPILYAPLFAACKVATTNHSLPERHVAGQIVAEVPVGQLA